MLSVVFTHPSLADLNAIGAYIADDNPVRALSFVDELERFCLGIGDFPHLGRSCEDIGFPTFRRFHYGRYTVFYRIEAEVVEIIRILNSAVDIQAALTT